MKEITVSAKLSAVKGFNLAKDSGLVKVDLTGTAFVNTVQNIGTTQEQLIIPAEVSTPGYAYFLNLDPTNYVEIGVYTSSVFSPLIKLKPLEPAVLRLATTTVYAKAHTAAVNLEYFVLQD